MTGNPSWKILVPTHSNEGVKYSVDYHRRWDEAVMSISGGVTINKPAKGKWASPEGELFYEDMIPVEVICSREEMREIANLTMNHYRQLAVRVDLVSPEAWIINKNNLDDLL